MTSKILGFTVFSHFRFLCLFEGFIEDDIYPLRWGTMFQVLKVSEGTCTVLRTVPTKVDFALRSIISPIGNTYILLIYRLRLCRRPLFLYIRFYHIRDLGRFVMCHWIRIGILHSTHW